MMGFMIWARGLGWPVHMPSLPQEYDLREVEI